MSARRLRARVNELVSDLDRLALAPPANGRRRRRRTNRARRTPVVPVTGTRNFRGGNRNVAPLADGELRLTKSELLSTVRSGDQGKYYGVIPIEPVSFPLLANVFKAFERVRWERVSISWRPAVGTTVGGLVTYGIDWDRQNQTVAERKQIAAYSPSCTHAIWADNSNRPMVLPADRLSGRLWYVPASSTADPVDKGPADLVFGASGPPKTELGEFWVTYTVRLVGTKP